VNPTRAATHLLGKVVATYPQGHALGHYHSEWAGTMEVDHARPAEDHNPSEPGIRC
jgi:hypothetical protein